jgi:hypothetical protein
MFWPESWPVWTQSDHLSSPLHALMPYTPQCRCANVPDSHTTRAPASANTRTHARGSFWRCKCTHAREQGRAELRVSRSHARVGELATTCFFLCSRLCSRMHRYLRARFVQSLVFFITHRLLRMLALAHVCVRVCVHACLDSLSRMRVQKKMLCANYGAGATGAPPLPSAAIRFQSSLYE